MSTTSLTRRPFADITEVRTRMDRLFDDLVGRMDDGRWTPALDVHRTDEALTLKADVPGYKPEDVHVQIKEGVLTISGEHTEESTEEEDGYVRRERRTGAFHRALALPAEADAKNVSAVVKDGVAEITIPLTAEQTEPTIEITPQAG